MRVAIEGFALLNGHLPCPATPASNGYVATAVGGCVTPHGFVPATSLDLNGKRNPDNLLLDPWGSPLRYSVTDSDADSDGNWDFVTASNMRTVTMPALAPDLVVCTTATGASATDCANANVTLAASTPAVVYSYGKDWAAFSSTNQQENAGTNISGGASGARYAIAADSVFVQADHSTRSGEEFDDLLIWLPTSSLYARLVRAGHLP